MGFPTSIIRQGDGLLGQGSVSLGPPEPKEDPSRYRVQRVRKEDIKTKFGWTDAQWEAAQALGFPSGQLHQTGDHRWKRWIDWTDAEVEAWAAKVKSLGL